MSPFSAARDVERKGYTFLKVHLHTFHPTHPRNAFFSFAAIFALSDPAKESNVAVTLWEERSRADAGPGV